MTEPDEDDPITLEEACKLVFRGNLKASTLRLEASRGNVEIFKVGRRFFTTLRSVRGMREKCREKPKDHAYTLIGIETSGLSETEKASSALVALSQTTRALKRGSRNT